MCKGVLCSFACYREKNKVKLGVYQYGVLKISQVKKQNTVQLLKRMELFYMMVRGLAKVQGHMVKIFPSIHAYVCRENVCQDTLQNINSGYP